MNVWEKVYRKNSSVVLREIADEILLVPVRGRLAQLQRLFVLNPVAHHIWQEIDGLNTLDAIHQSVVNSFEVPTEEARTDLLELIESLGQAELIESHAGSVSAP
jgi:hypothetical protein